MPRQSLSLKWGSCSALQISSGSVSFIGCHITYWMDFLSFTTFTLTNVQFGTNSERRGVKEGHSPTENPVKSYLVPNATGMTTPKRNFTCLCSN